ncbi:GntR family transcriptional regulator [Pseudonocardia sp. H11422]|uniref:GntR family transcriptional regulator n=1 Tax=Pseudonocardia sp. H11422 TaxID=2835866 RepID=UPI0027E26EA3|nr:GntR family transcriptional regulator [Pseudonocardia sp. H11422]
MTRASERALEAVREMILRGEVAPGLRLGEVELAERLGVSRTPVREALTRLAAEGLVEISPNRGARVTSWSVAELEGVFDLRAALEPRAAARAACRADAADLAALDELATEMLAVGSPGPGQDLDALFPLNREFHGRLVTLADHPALATALAGAIHAPIVLRNFHAYDDASLLRSLAHHAEIVAAARAGDPEWAQAVMTAHIHNARAVMIRAAAAAQNQKETGS